MRAIRNFSVSFVDGIRGTALKKDNVVKHSRSDMHSKALNMERAPTKTLTQIFKSTPLGKAMATASSEEPVRLGKLFDVAYMIAKEEMPFTKYPCIVELEKRHGVSLGTAYSTDRKCKECTSVIGDTLKDDVVAAVRRSRYLGVLMDGYTDSSVVENELIYVLMVDSNGKLIRSTVC
eukprot:scpid98535/ scgid32949/ 